MKNIHPSRMDYLRRKWNAEPRLCSKYGNTLPKTDAKLIMIFGITYYKDGYVYGIEAAAWGNTPKSLHKCRQAITQRVVDYLELTYHHIIASIGQFNISGDGPVHKPTALELAMALKMKGQIILKK